MVERAGVGLRQHARFVATSVGRPHFPPLCHAPTIAQTRQVGKGSQKNSVAVLTPLKPRAASYVDEASLQALQDEGGACCGSRSCGRGAKGAGLPPLQWRSPRRVLGPEGGGEKNGPRWACTVKSGSKSLGPARAGRCRGGCACLQKQAIIAHTCTTAPLEALTSAR